MTADAWLTAAVVVAILVALAFELAAPSVLVFSSVVFLLLADVIDAGQALSGFSNPAPFTVGALLIVAGAISKTGAIRPFTQRLLGRTGHVRRPMVRMLLPVTAASGLMNNIPLVAMMIPEISTWARRRKIDASRFLLPLSYGAILGGLLTLIGTSTNLVVAGMMDESGMEPFSFFELGKVGLPLAVAGMVTMVLIAPRLLKGRHSPGNELTTSAREFSIEMEVVSGGPLEHLTVDQAGLRHLEGVFLISVDHGDTIVAPASPDTTLRGGDVLQFVGKVDQVLDLETVKGLRHAVHHEVLGELASSGHAYFTVAIGGDSPLIGRTLKQTGFRSQYQAAVLAIHRAGERIDAKLGEVPLKIGDALIVMSDPGFRARWEAHPDFLLIAGLNDELRPPAPGGRRTLLIVGAMVILAATGVLPILHASLGAALLLVVTGVLTPSEARRNLDLNVLGVIASAFGLAAAVETTGLGQALADGLVTLFGGLGQTGILVAAVVATIALTELITNNAAALLMFPIALGVAPEAGVDPRGMAVAIAIAASASFLTPIGYQTNTMVYGPGGYRISDYFKVGLPMTALAVAAIVVLVPVLY